MYRFLHVVIWVCITRCNWSVYRWFYNVYFECVYTLYYCVYFCSFTPCILSVYTHYIIMCIFVVLHRVFWVCIHIILLYVFLSFYTVYFECVYTSYYCVYVNKIYMSRVIGMCLHRVYLLYCERVQTVYITSAPKNQKTLWMRKFLSHNYTKHWSIAS